MKINETSKERLKLLYICHFNDNAYCGPIGRDNVSMTRGRSGFEFVITLSNVTTDDIGTYEATVERVDPGHSKRARMYKKFHLGK